MSSINVNRNVSDIFYRYKMPRICAKVEGKGNGIKTVLVNMAEVAKALSRPATYITKYFGCELGAQTQFDFKNERFIVNGSHDSTKLQDLLDGFIRKFVLCPECDNPETELIVSTKRNSISQACKACGYHGHLIFHHKLNTHILKNPPDHSTVGSSLTGSHRNKRSKRSGTSSHIKQGVENSKNDVSATSLKTDTTTITHQKGIQPEIDENWTVDISEEAVRARWQDLSEGAKTIMLDDNEKSEKQRMDLFYNLIKQRLASSQISGPKRAKEILHEAEKLDVKSKAPLILFELLIRPSHITADVRMHRALMLRFTLSDVRAQRSALYALDAMCAQRSTLITKIPALLKLLYDEDIVEEKTIMEWAAKPSRKYASRQVAIEVRQKAEPFIKWLSEADEEDSDATEEVCGEDVEIEYDETAMNTTIKNDFVLEKNKDESDGEVDIDSI